MTTVNCIVQYRLKSAAGTRADKYYHDVVETKLSDLLAMNPECRECGHWLACAGGCMLNGILGDGDFLVPDPQICWFHKNVGEAGVRAVADAALAALPALDQQQRDGVG